MKARTSSAVARAFSFFVLAPTACALLLFATSGCALPIKKSGDRTHLMILGFGIVSVNGVHNEAAVVSRAHALGIQVSTAPHFDCGIGYSSRSTVIVADGADDVRIEVSSAPFGYLVVVPKAQLATQFAAPASSRVGRPLP